jgi:hypothetical protein
MTFIDTFVVDMKTRCIRYRKPNSDWEETVTVGKPVLLEENGRSFVQFKLKKPNNIVYGDE